MVCARCLGDFTTFPWGVCRVFVVAGRAGVAVEALEGDIPRVVEVAVGRCCGGRGFAGGCWDEKRMERREAWRVEAER